jgi:hypothetical protein
MLIKTVRHPGEKGTKKLVDKYGSKLICVRYRYDPQQHKRYKTVELIIEEAPWQPESPNCTTAPPPQQAPHRVGVRIGYQEKIQQQAIKAIGGIWSSRDRLWYAEEELVKRIGLQDRITDT